MAEEIQRRLRMDHDTIQKVSKLTRYHDWRVEPAERNVRRAVNRMGRELFPLLLKVQTADTLAQSRWYREEKLDRIRKVQQVYRIILEGESVCVPEGTGYNGKGPHRPWDEAGVLPSVKS